MLRHLRTALVLLVLAVASAGAQTIPPPALAPAPGIYAEAVDSARLLILERMNEVGIPGFSVAVGVEGEVVWSEGFGYADLENRVPVWPRTKFRVASISKALTAAAVGRLVEDGRLDLDAPVQRYVPSFPEKRWPVTTRLLGGHLAGVRHYRGREMLSSTHYDDVVDALVIFSGDSLLHEPGTEYQYSTYGWNLISAVVQEAAGEPFLDYMRRTVFDPLRMNETVAEHPDSLIYHRARFYVRTRDEHILNAPYVDTSNKWAGGGFLSTSPDLVRYGQAYLTEGFLARETIDLLWTSQRTADGEPTGYGIGWSVRESEGERLIYHTGGATGGSTILMVLPDSGVVVAILTNLQSVRHVDTARAIGRLFAGVEG